MDAIILAAWQWTRLRPITETTPKWLIPINGVTVLDNLTERIAQLPIHNAYLVTNKHAYPIYQKWLKSYKGSLNITLIQQKIEAGKKKGTIKTLQHLIKQHELKDDFFICAADNFFNFSLVPSYKLFLQKKAPLIISHNTHDWEIASHHSILKYHPTTHRITHLFPQCWTPRDTLCMTFLIFFPHEAKKYINEYINEHKNPDKVGKFLERLKKFIPLYTNEIITKKWFDIGNYYSLYKAKKTFGEKKVTLERLQKWILK